MSYEKDWYGDDGIKGRHGRFKEALRPAGKDEGIIAAASDTDFLQAISLFHTRDRRRAAEQAGKTGKGEVRARRSDGRSRDPGAERHANAELVAAKADAISDYAIDAQAG